MAVRVTAAHTAEARAEAGREAGEGGVAAAAAALAPGGFLGLPAPFSEEGNRAAQGWARPGWGRLSLAGGGPDDLSCGRDTYSQASFLADLVGLRGTPQSFPRALCFFQALGPHPAGRRSPPAWGFCAHRGYSLVSEPHGLSVETLAIGSTACRPRSVSESRQGPALRCAPSSLT